MLLEHHLLQVWHFAHDGPYFSAKIYHLLADQLGESSFHVCTVLVCLFSCLNTLFLDPFLSDVCEDRLVWLLTLRPLLKLNEVARYTIDNGAA